mmetsp:Transcript_18119/g.40929  ORF Transcript_18119/g.40929 Transcript_18119/m.40929 type:complete len:84 (-) Transcript_18119:17-268(-)
MRHASASDRVSRMLAPYEWVRNVLWSLTVAVCISVSILPVPDQDVQEEIHCLNCACLCKHWLQAQRSAGALLTISATQSLCLV